MNKISIRFYKDHKVRAVWDEENDQWWFSVLDIVGAINEQDDHEKNRNYWKYLKAKFASRHPVPHRRRSQYPPSASSNLQIKKTQIPG